MSLKRNAVMPALETEDLSLYYDNLNEGGSTTTLLLHGWPHDMSTWDGVKGRLVETGNRLIITSLRGFGSSRFRCHDAPRTANPSIHAMDMIALLDALAIERVAVIGHDLG